MGLVVDNSPDNEVIATSIPSYSEPKARVSFQIDEYDFGTSIVDDVSITVSNGPGDQVE